MTPKPTLATLLQLAWPIVVSRSTQVVVGVSDAVMVAHLGETAVAAVTTGSLNVMAVLILPMGICFIVSSFSSQLFGQGDAVGARRYGFYGLGISAITQLLCLAGIPFIDDLLAQLSYSPELRALMREYLAIRLLAGGAAIGIEALANYYGGLGDTRRPMVASVVAMVLNVFGNWLLIDGHWGIAPMGVKGAAFASALSTSVAFLGFAIVFLFQGRTAGRIVPKLSLGEFVRMLRFGVPSGLNWFFEFFAFNFFVNVVVAGLGTTALAAMMSVLQITTVSFMPAFAVASAGAILVGQAIGANRKDDVSAIVRLGFLTSAAWELVAGVVFVLFPLALLLPFAKNDQEAVFLTIGTRLLMLSAAWGLFDAAVNTLAEALRAAGDTAFTLWARVAIAWIVFVPGSYVTVRWYGQGDVGAMLWLIAYLMILALFLFVRFRSGAWRRLQLVEPRAAAL